MSSQKTKLKFQRTSYQVSDLAHEIETNMRKNHPYNWPDFFKKIFKTFKITIPKIKGAYPSKERNIWDIYTKFRRDIRFEVNAFWTDNHSLLCLDIDQEDNGHIQLIADKYLCKYYHTFHRKQGEALSNRAAKRAEGFALAKNLSKKEKRAYLKTRDQYRMMTQMYKNIELLNKQIKLPKPKRNLKLA